MQPLNQALPGALASLLRDVPNSHGKVDLAWKTAVGPAVERVTAVRLEDGVLFVEVPDANWDREITRSMPIILRRLATLLGENAVTSVRIRRHPR
jgi:predicted nucleic acid-binding Zn ribbon protein